MPVFKHRKPASEETGDLLDLPLGGTAKIERGTPERNLGNVDAIGSLQRRRRPRRLSAGWLWLIFLLAFPLGGLVGYLLSTDPPVAALSTDFLDFGEVRLGTMGAEQTIRVSNQGEKVLRLAAAVLTGEAAGEFRVVADGCVGLEVSSLTDCALRLAFAPTGRGARRARIRLDSNAQGGTQTLPLIGVGVAPELVIEPLEIDLGRQSVGGAGAPAVLRVANRGTAPLQLGRIALGGPAAGDFRRVARLRGAAGQTGCGSRLLLPGERCSVRFVFAPGEAGERRAELRIESDAAGSRTVVLKGYATRRSPILRLDPAELDFEPLPVTGTSPGRTITLANDGNGPLAIDSVRLEGDAASVFEVAAESCTEGQVLAAGACEIELRFRPGTEGEALAFLAIDSNVAPEPHRIPLRGTGTAAHVAIAPERLSFGEVAVRASSTTGVVRVTSSGSDRLKIGAVTVTGADAVTFTTDGCAGTELAPGGQCLLEVLFRPRRPGPHRADLQIKHNAGDRRHVLPLNGLGVVARLSLDRGSIDFGEAGIGSETRRRLVLTNAGRTELKILRVRLTGSRLSGSRLSGSRSAGSRSAGHADFELDAVRCTGVTLGPNATCTVALTFRPTSAGSHHLRLVIDHNAGGSAREVPVTAGAAAPPEPKISLEPVRFDFPDRRVGERGTIKTLTVSNPGTGRLSLEAIQLAGDHSSDFQLVPGSCAGASFVAPGASCTVGIRFVPTAPGPRSARLLIRHNAVGRGTSEGGAVEVELQGRGTELQAIR